VTPYIRLAGDRARRGRRPGVLLAALLAALALAACGGSAATFDPAGPCVVDGRRAGAYPALEARLPSDLKGAAPTSVDSGRNCSVNALDSLISHDVEAVTFAGAIWDLGGGTGVTSVVFALPAADGASPPALPAAWIAEFYEIGAETAKRTENIVTSRPTYEGTGEAWRLDTLNGLSLQSVVTWGDGDIVRSVLVASAVSPGASRDAHETLLEEAVAAAVSASEAPP
jgi:hypothetical protein